MEHQLPLKVILVAGARPNFMKIAPLMQALGCRPERFKPFLVHTGQHYDAALSKVFFDELRIPRPDCNLEVGSGSQAQQTADVMVRFEPVLREQGPHLVVVVGDVNSTVACSIVAAKASVPVAHVEAGLRSFDRRMPEEINRVLTDSISDLLFVSEPSGVENLRREGVPEKKIHLVGNVMVDTLLQHRETAESSSVLGDLGLVPSRYGVLTLHRPSNVDDPEVLRRILSAVGQLDDGFPIVFPVHPRTRTRIGALGLDALFEARRSLRLVEPLGYLDFLKLQAHARFVATDSGGIQEETTVLGIPCITIRENTERPVTLSEGTNVLVGTDPTRILLEVRRAMGGERVAPKKPPELWDGKAADRIVAILDRELGR